MINRQPKSLTAIAAFICLTWCFVIFLPVNARAQTDDIRQLSPNQTIEREMTGAETHRYQFDLQAGEFFQVRVEQKGVDVALKLLDADNNTLATMDSPNSKEDFEMLSFVAAKTSGFILEIRTADITAEIGEYILTRTASREATVKERVSFADLLSANAEKLENTIYPIIDNAERLNKEEKEIQLNKVRSILLNVIALYKNAIILTKDTEKDIFRIYYLYEIGQNYRFIEDFQKSIDYLQQSLKLNNSDKFSSVAFQHQILVEIAFAYDDAENEAEAIKYYEKAVIGYEDNWSTERDQKSLFSIIGRFENLLIATSDYRTYQEINQIQQQLLKLTKKFNLRDLEPLLNLEIGKTYYDMGQYDKAIEKYNEAKELNEKNAYIEERITRGIATIYLRTGRLNEAENLYKKSMVLATSRRDNETVIIDKINIGCVYAKTNDLSKNRLAVKIFKINFPEMEKWQRLTNDRVQKLQYARYVLETAFYYALAYRKIGDFDNAIQILKKAIENTKKYKILKYESRALVEIGLNYLLLHNLKLAFEKFKDAYFLSRKTNVRDEEIAALDGLMRVWQSLGNLQLAIIYGKQSVNLLQQTRNDLLKSGTEFAKEFLYDNLATYRKLAEILISKSRLLEAQTVLDLLKEEEFSGLITRGSNGETSVPYSNAETVALDALDRVAALGREKGELEEKIDKKIPLSEPEKQRVREIRDKIDIAEAEFDKSLAALSGAKHGEQDITVVMKDAQAFMSELKDLGKGTVALYTVIVNDDKPTIDGKPAAGAGEQIKTGWIILVTPEFRKQYAIDVENLNQTISAFRETLRSDVYDPKPLARTLYAKLFQQKGKDGRTLEADLDEYFKDKPEKTLMWSLDGVLRYVPMAALYDGSDYLVAKYRNTIFTTASKGRLNADVKKDWTVLGLGVSQAREESGKTFPKIDGTKRELDSIVSENDADEGILKGKIELDGQFTAETMRDALDFDKNPVVHIASHFSFDPTDVDGSKSFLLLGKGKLTVQEMSVKSTLFSNVDLLALSACDTAMGSGNGKEVEGFAYVAQSLGAKAVLASLWQVADTGTDELMIRFYELRKKNPQMPKGEAFRQAQLEMLFGEKEAGAKLAATDAAPSRSGVVDLGGGKIELTRYEKDLKHPFAHPHYWASFVLIGNWR